MNILITGACGLLGAHLAARLSPDHDVVGMDRHPWWGDAPLTLHQGDLTDALYVERVVEAAAPDVLIHCAAMVDVEACERDPAMAYAVNAGVTRHLVRLAGPSCSFVYITTDSLFRGDMPGMTERDLPCPRTEYARSKLHGEWEVELGAPRHIIARTNFFGGSSGAKRTFGEWLYGALERGDAITLFDDAMFTPIYVGDLAAAIDGLVARGACGVFNVCGADRVSKYEFGMRLARIAGFATAAVTRGSIAQSGQAASRPKDMSLDGGKLCDTLGQPLASVDDGLRQFVADRRRPLSRRGPSRAAGRMRQD